MIHSYDSETSQILPGLKTYNSDVEAAHRLIEGEFYEMEDYKNKKDLLSKALAYIREMSLIHNVV